MRKALLFVMAVGLSTSVARAGHRYWYGGSVWGPWWGPPAYYYGGSPNRGAVDCDIEPEDARVFVDGRQVGEADDFDGFPKYLVLKPGKRRVEFRHKGYRTLVVEVDMKPGWLFRIEEEMERGDPENRVLRKSGAPPAYQDDDDRPRRAPRDAPSEDEPRDEDRDDAYDDEDDKGYEPSSMRARPPRDESYRARASIGEPSEGSGRVRFKVSPADARIYIDGEYQGMAGEIRQRGGLDLAPGDHQVVVTSEGYEDRELLISVDDGTSSEVNVELPEATAS